MQLLLLENAALAAGECSYCCQGCKLQGLYLVDMQSYPLTVQLLLPVREPFKDLIYDFLHVSA